MSKLTDRISYLQGLAEGMKLNPDKDSHRLILGILDVLGEVGDSFEALAEAHGELSDYVESIDEDLADLEADLYDDEDEDVAEEEEEEAFESTIEYECPHCGAVITLDPDGVDFDDTTLCPECGKDLFPELPEGAEEEPEEEAGEYEDYDAYEDDEEDPENDDEE